MTVWVLLAETIDSSKVVGIYTSKALAEAQKATLKLKYPRNRFNLMYEIEKYEVEGAEE